MLDAAEPLGAWDDPRRHRRRSTGSPIYARDHGAARGVCTTPWRRRPRDIPTVVPTSSKPALCESRTDDLRCPSLDVIPGRDSAGHPGGQTRFDQSTETPGVISVVVDERGNVRGAVMRVDRGLGDRRPR